MNKKEAKGKGTKDAIESERGNAQKEEELAQ
jgi:hypothetical protein